MNNQNSKKIKNNPIGPWANFRSRPNLSGLVAYGRCQAERPRRPMAGNSATLGAASARSRPVRWRGRRRLMGAHGGAKPAVQSRGSLEACAR
jgi:hypothetical protein